jgi:cbb3-type cytochrome oxidase subunit 3
MTDRSLGIVLITLGILGGITYLYWMFAPTTRDNLLFYAPNLEVRWAIAIPVLVIVLAIFFLAVWIGWTMVATPPPLTRPTKSQDGG